MTQTEDLARYLELWHRTKLVAYAAISWFLSIGAQMMLLSTYAELTTRFDLYLAPPVLTVSVVVAVVFLCRNRIMLAAARRTSLPTLYRVGKFLEDASLFSIIILFVTPFIAVISRDPEYARLVGQAWTRYFGIAAMISPLSSFLSVLNQAGKTKVYYEKAISCLDDFEKSRKWLTMSLKAVEQFLERRDIRVSYEDLFYKLNMMVIKNNDIKPVLNTLKNALLSGRPDGTSLYDSLVGVLGDPGVISQVKRLSLKGLIGSASRLPAHEILKAVAYVVSAAILILAGRQLPLP